MKKLLIVGATCLASGFAAGMNTGRVYYGHTHIWDIDRNGLNDLDENMKQDTSERKAVMVFTEKGTYSTQSIEGYDKGGHKGFRVLGAIVDADNKILYGNVDKVNVS